MWCVCVCVCEHGFVFLQQLFRCTHVKIVLFSSPVHSIGYRTNNWPSLHFSMGNRETLQKKMWCVHARSLAIAVHEKNFWRREKPNVNEKMRRNTRLPFRKVANFARCQSTRACIISSIFFFNAFLLCSSLHFTFYHNSHAADGMRDCMRKLRCCPTRVLMHRRISRHRAPA